MTITDLISLLVLLITVGAATVAIVNYMQRRPAPRELVFRVGAVALSCLVVIALIATFLVLTRNTQAGRTPLVQLFSAATPTAILTASVTAIPGPTATPTVTPTPLPTATALPTPPYVLCTSGANDNWSGWPIGGAWKVLNGQLLNDGTDGGGSNQPFIAPAKCQPPTPDYLVEVAIQDPRPAICSTGRCGFGIWARMASGTNGETGYTLASYPCCGDVDILGIAQSNPNPGSAKHTYGLQVKGNVITIFLDGGQIASAIDNTYLYPGQVALWTEGGDQMVVTSFKVTMLQ